MSDATVVVVVPVYRPVPTETEVVSLARCVAVLGAHPLVLVGPVSLDPGRYREIAPGARYLGFDDRFFRSVASYSELLLAADFYDRFSGYRFMLIHQTDAFVFEDRLLDWCGRGYDYVGAPWYDSRWGWWGVGNGGFCLRNVESCLNVLRSSRRADLSVYWELVKRTTRGRLARVLKYPSRVAREFGVIGGDVGSTVRGWVRRGEPEDTFWGLHAVGFDPAFRVAPVAEALRFAVEGGLEDLGDSVAREPPFGCHRGWFLEAIVNYTDPGRSPRTGHERLIWGIARGAGLPRGGRG